MNNSPNTLTKVLNGINSTLNIVNKAVPLYKETKPLIKGMKSTINTIKNSKNDLNNMIKLLKIKNEMSKNNNVPVLKNSNISNTQKIEQVNTYNKVNNPTFFI